MVPAGDTIRFECELLAVQSGLGAFAVRAGLMGVGSVVPGLAIIALTNLGCYLFYGWSMMDPRVWMMVGPPDL